MITIASLASVALSAIVYSIMQTGVHSASRANVIHIKAYRTKIDPLLSRLVGAYYAVSSTGTHDTDI